MFELRIFLKKKQQTQFRLNPNLKSRGIKRTKLSSNSRNKLRGGLVLSPLILPKKDPYKIGGFSSITNKKLFSK